MFVSTNSQMALVFLSASSIGAMHCPASAAWGPACGMQITTTAAASCSSVLAEIKARVAAQPDGWHDPHNKVQLGSHPGPAWIPRPHLRAPLRSLRSPLRSLLASSPTVAGYLPPGERQYSVGQQCDGTGQHVARHGRWQVHRQAKLHPVRREIFQLDRSRPALLPSSPQSAEPTPALKTRSRKAGRSDPSGGSTSCKAFESLW